MPMIYFDNAATSFPKPKEVPEAVYTAINSFGNPSRSAHKLALNATRSVEYARVQIAELFGCQHSQNVAFTSNVTEALNLAVNSIQGHVVTSASEHNSVLRPVYRKNNYTAVSVDKYGRYTVSDIKRALTAKTGAVVLGHASNLTGNIHPIAEIGALCREREILFIVDTAQTAGAVEFNMEDTGIDALCFTGHKSLYGPQGTGGICLSERFLPEPLVIGGSGSKSFDKKHPVEMPTRLEAGTVNSHGLAGLSAGLKYIKKHGLNKLTEHASSIAKYFYSGIKGHGKIIFYGDYQATRRMPIVTFNIQNIPSSEIAHILAAEYDIAVRGGTHCAPLLHESFGTARQGAVRFSFSHYNTIAEADAAIKAVHTIAGKY